MTRQSREAPILRAVRAAVAAQPGVLVWRNNSGADTVVPAARPQDRRFVRYGLGKGSADLVGIVAMRVCNGETLDGEITFSTVGRVFALEVKSSTGRASLDQRRWGDAVRKVGGFYAIVRSVDDALSALKRARAGAVE